MKIIFNLAIGLNVSEKRLYKLGFKKKEFVYSNKPKIVYVIGRHMTDCGTFDDTITYDPAENEISGSYGGNFPTFDLEKVESMYDIKKFISTRPTEKEEVVHNQKFGKGGEGFEIVMKHHGLYRLDVMKELKSYLNLSLKESKTLVDSVPVSIVRELSREGAEVLKMILETAGAEIEMK